MKAKSKPIKGMVMQIRISKSEKLRLERAAKIIGCSVSVLIRKAASDLAEKTVATRGTPKITDIRNLVSKLKESETEATRLQGEAFIAAQKTNIERADFIQTLAPNLDQLPTEVLDGRYVLVVDGDDWHPRFITRIELTDSGIEVMGEYNYFIDTFPPDPKNIDLVNMFRTNKLRVFVARHEHPRGDVIKHNYTVYIAPIEAVEVVNENEILDYLRERD